MPKSHRSRSRSLSGKSRRQSRMGSSQKRLKVVPKGVGPGHAKDLVLKGVYDKTRGGLRKSDLTVNANGRAVSKKQQANGRRLQKRFPWEKQKAFMKYAGRIQEL